MITEINEINLLPSNEIPSMPNMPENFKTSDEIVVGENNYDYKENEYAKAKRLASTIKKTILISVASITIVSTGVSFTNLINGDAVTINKFVHTVASNIFIYTLDVSIDKQKLLIEFTNDNNVVYTITYEQTGIYSNAVILENNKEYFVDLYSTNYFDLKAKLSDYSFIFRTM